MIKNRALLKQDFCKLFITKIYLKKTLDNIIIKEIFFCAFFLLFFLPGAALSLGSKNIEEAAAAEKRGEIIIAIQLYTKAIESKELTRDKLASAHYARANCFAKIGENNLAIEDTTKALMYSPSGPIAQFAYHVRGLAFSEQENFVDAIKDFSKSIELNPNYVDPLYARGLAYVKSGNINLAVSDFLKAIKLDQKYYLAYLGLGNIYADNNDPSKAIKYYDEAIKSNPNYSLSYYGRGRFRLTQGNYDAGISDLNKAVELDPNDKDSYNSLGAAYIFQNKYEIAIKFLTKAIELDPNFANAYFNRSLAYARNLQPKESIKDAKFVLKLAPNHPNREQLERIISKYDK